MFVIPPTEPKQTLQKVKQSVSDAELLYLAFAWLASVVDEVRQEIDAVGLTVSDVFSVLRYGELGDPARRITNRLCSPEYPPLGEDARLASFCEKAMRLSLRQRVGIALPLHEAWREGEADDRAAIVARFKAHGVRLLG